MNVLSLPITQRASLAIIFGASAWGLFWIPLRYFDENGLVSLWAVVAINTGAFAVALPLAILRGRAEATNPKWITIIGLGFGISNVLYFSGLILSDVVRVIFLFYLLPFWATLFSYLFFGVPIGRSRLVALGIALVGLWLLLGAGGWPIPQNLGDIFGLISGMGWAFGLTALRAQGGNLGILATTATGFAAAIVIALIMALILNSIDVSLQPAFPEFNVILFPALLAILFGAFILWSTTIGQFWGAQFIAATTAALFTMSEILVATVSATVLGASELALVSWLGAGLILAAIFIDAMAGDHA